MCLHAFFMYVLHSTLEPEINECDGNHDCEQVCINTIDSFQCACQHGYFLALDGKRCQGM